MSELSDIRDALKSTLDGAGWSRDFTVFAYYPGSLPSGPVVVIEPQGEYTDWYLTMGTGRRSQVNLQLRFLVPLGGSDESAQRILDEVLSQGSAELSSLSDLFGPNATTTRTLGGLVDDVAVKVVSEYGFTDLALERDAPAVPYIGCVVPVTIYVQRS